MLPFVLFQAKREAAYFIVVLHSQRTVVIAVRGTETPEDLITDGLCRECMLSVEDLDGLLKYVAFFLPSYPSKYEYFHLRVNISARV